MVATIWLFSLLSTTMLQEIECMYESPVVEYEIKDPFTSVEEINVGESKATNEGKFETGKASAPLNSSKFNVVNCLEILRINEWLSHSINPIKRLKISSVELNRAILKNVGKRVNHLNVMDYNRLGKEQMKQMKQKLTSAPYNNDDLHIKYLYSLKYNNV